MHIDRSARTPRFSVLIPVFNRRDLVRLTIDSVLGQTFTDYEVIVIDDGSTDRTLDLLLSYGSRITVLTQRNSGAEAARGKGVEVAQGEYFVLLDSDDLLYPTALANYDRVIRSLNSPPVLLGAMSYFRDGDTPPANKSEGEPIRCISFDDFLAKDRGFGISCSNIVIKRSVAIATGALRKKATAFPFDGTDIMLLVGTSGPCVLMLSPFTIAYRSHATNTVGRLDYLLENAACLARFERLGHYPGGPKRRFDRRAYAGGVAWHYASQGLRRGMYKLAILLLLETFPMVVLGTFNTVRRRLHKPRQAITL